MAKKSKKYYVVWKGNKEGIYPTWEECKRQVLGVPGAKYKSFPTLVEAEQAFKNGWERTSKPSSEKTKQTFTQKRGIHGESTYIEDSISVDAACSGNPGAMEYKGVYTKTGQVLFHFGPILGTNNIGEFLAIVHGLAFLAEKGMDIPVYSDSLIALKWVRAKKVNTSLRRDKDTEQVWTLIERAEKWLKDNQYQNPLLKWETDQWGEVKADFGRK